MEALFALDVLAGMREPLTTRKTCEQTPAHTPSRVLKLLTRDFTPCQYTRVLASRVLALTLYNI